MCSCPERSTQPWPEPEQNRADRPRLKPYLLFDAGGTLVFPDQSFLIKKAREHGIELTHEQLFQGYCQLIYSLDQETRKQGSFPHDPWPQGYAQALFETLGVGDAAAHVVVQAAVARHQHRNLWTFTFNWVPETLFLLAAQGYRMSVISNSDGRTAEVFRDLNLAHYFERIFDSNLLAMEKPDPALFELALHELNLQPGDALYIGDTFEVDVRGANQAGLGALHLDPLGLYTDWPGVHLTDVRHLPDWLARYTATPSVFDLFPTRNSDRTPMLTSEAQDTFSGSCLETNSELPTEASNDIWSFRPSFLQLRR
jgi:FMN phosphatase YigB (HAD superfamily)